jgi:hypothetical protein
LIAAADLDNDGATDLLFMTGSGIFLVFNRHSSLEKGARVTQASSALAIVDLENHGLEDIAVSGAVFRNRGLGRFTEIKVRDLDSSVLTAIDFDGDGRTDLIEIQRDGSLVFLRNETKRK